MPAVLDQAATLRAMAAGRRPAAAAACTRCHGDTGARTVWENLGIALAGAGRKALLLPMAYGSFWKQDAPEEKDEPAVIEDHYGMYRLEAPLPVAPGDPRLRELFAGRHGLARGMDVLLLECGYGSSSRAKGILALAPAMLLVQTCDTHSILSSYELVKRVAKARREAGLPPQRLLLLANKAASPAAGREVLERFSAASERFLGLKPVLLGALPADPKVAEARAAGIPVSVIFPGCAFSRCLTEAAGRLMEGLCRIQ